MRPRGLSRGGPENGAAGVAEGQGQARCAAEEGNEWRSVLRARRRSYVSGSGRTCSCTTNQPNFTINQRQALIMLVINFGFLYFIFNLNTVFLYKK